MELCIWNYVSVYYPIFIKFDAIKNFVWSENTIGAQIRKYLRCLTFMFNFATFNLQKGRSYRKNSKYRYI